MWGFGGLEGFVIGKHGCDIKSLEQSSKLRLTVRHGRLWGWINPSMLPEPSMENIRGLGNHLRKRAEAAMVAIDSKLMESIFIARYRIHAAKRRRDDFYKQKRHAARLLRADADTWHAWRLRTCDGCYDDWYDNDWYLQDCWRTAGESAKLSRERLRMTVRRHQIAARVSLLLSVKKRRRKPRGKVGERLSDMESLHDTICRL